MFGCCSEGEMILHSSIHIIVSLRDPVGKAFKIWYIKPYSRYRRESRWIGPNLDEQLYDQFVAVKITPRRRSARRRSHHPYPVSMTKQEEFFRLRQ